MRKHCKQKVLFNNITINNYRSDKNTNRIQTPIESQDLEFRLKTTDDNGSGMV